MLFFSVALGCHDWDAFDPRLGVGGGASGGAAGTGTAATGATTTGTTNAATTSSATTSVTSTSTGPAGGGGQGGGGSQVAYTGVVADCIDPTLPDPDACETFVGTGALTVDGNRVTTATPRHAFLRFDLDGVLQGATIDAVALRVVVTNGSGADSTSTAEVWEVAPFTRPDLFMAEPAQVSAGPVSPDQGAVVQGQEVLFPLPTTLVVADGSVFLGLFPLTSNGVDYFNLNGAEPPQLIVDYH